ncbi:hypothetical protein AB0I10_34600 [Streptomyces sp. NPDC050636]|uniref:hypothetical protein n=1 Tax=Streptomyces sp. NPDC050636 TaxID=3154510 RepID=UPI0034327E8C
MRKPEAKLVADLDAAGLLFREVIPTADQLLPVSVAMYMGYLRPEEGRVALAPAWDVAGVGSASGALGAGAGNPTFIMASLDGEVLMKSGYYQVGIDLSIVARPRSVARLREQARRLAFSEHLESAQRRWAERWLAGTPKDSTDTDDA